MKTGELFRLDTSKKSPAGIPTNGKAFTMNALQQRKVNAILRHVRCATLWFQCNVKISKSYPNTRKDDEDVKMCLINKWYIFLLPLFSYDYSLPLR